MRRILFIILIFQFIFSYAQQDKSNLIESKFYLKGKLNGRDTGHIILRHPNTLDKWVNDTAVLENGKFEFKGTINEPSFAHLIGSNKPGNYVDLYIEPTKQQIEITENNFSSFIMHGSKTQLEKVSLYKEIDQLENEIKNLRTNFDQINQMQIDSSSHVKQLEEIEVLIQDRYSKIRNYKIEFIKTHPDSYVSATELNGLIVNRTISLNLADSLLEKFTVRIKQGMAYRYGFEEVEKSRPIRKGKTLPDFTIADINGNSVSLSQFKGKYLLIDFWASWCIPCRKAVPKLKETYNKYGGDRFEILAISKDKIQQDWTDAVRKDAIDSWYNIIMNKELDSLFQSVVVIPTQLLIDPNGKIIWSSMENNEGSWEEMLIKKLEILGRKPE